MGRPKLPTRPCAVDGCHRDAKARGWCKTHWLRWRKTGDPLGIIGQPRIDVLTRIMRRVVKHDGGCWIFMGHLNRQGYGQVTLSTEDGRALVHRVVYMRLVGPVPQGKELDHRCRVRACCNPAHLEPVTHLENVRRGDASAVHRARHADASTCGKGHPRTPENIRITARGERRCRPCCATWAREARDRKKAAA